MVDEDCGLRERLGIALDQVTPSPPPVAIVLRKGRVMRIGQRAAIGAGLAVIVVAAVTVPGLLHQSARPARPSTAVHAVHVKVRPTILQQTRLGARAVGGVIAEGTARTGKVASTWRIWVDKQTDKVYARIADGSYNKRWTLGNLGAAELVTGIEAFDNAPIEAWFGSYGVVRPDVTRIEVVVSHQKAINLYPVAADGFRWVGFISPISVAGVTSETAYAGRAVVGQLTGFHGQLVSWVDAGQRAPAPATVQISSGALPNGRRWQVVVQAGPWGYCVSLLGKDIYDFENDCLSPAAARAAGVKVGWPSNPGPNARWLVGTVTASVASVRLSLQDLRTIRVPVVTVDGQRFFAVCIVRGQQIQQWGAYDASGRELYGGIGEP